MADTTTNIGGHVARLVEPAEDPAEPGPKPERRSWWSRLWNKDSVN